MDPDIKNMVNLMPLTPWSMAHKFNNFISNKQKKWPSIQPSNPFSGWKPWCLVNIKVGLSKVLTIWKNRNMGLFSMRASRNSHPLPCGAHPEPHLSIPHYLPMYGGGGSDDHPKPLIGGQQVFTVQNKLRSQSNGPIHLDWWLFCGPHGWANSEAHKCEQTGSPHLHEQREALPYIHNVSVRYLKP